MRKLVSEILDALGFSSRALAGREDAEAWLKGKAGHCLLIAEPGPEGEGTAWIRRTRAAFPAIKVLSVPPHLRPSELYRYIEASFPAF